MKRSVTKMLQMATVLMIMVPLMFAGMVSAQPEEPEDLVNLTLPITLEDDNIDWDMAFFPFDGAAVNRVANPDPSGINESDYVIEYEKDGGEFWAGFFMHLEEGEIEITDETVVTMKVWSPRADLDATLKLEMQDADVDTGDMFAEITEEGEWIELKWDLEGVDQNTPWDLITIIMELEDGAVGEGGEDYTWYIDDINVEEEDATSSEIIDAERPSNFELSQNYPNPFNPTTQIQYTVPEQGQVSLKVYDMLGQEVSTLVEQHQSAGQYEATFDGSGLSSGTYIYRLEAGGFSESRTMLLVK